jgi:probable phosphomutase (TIGR03848 family)
MSPVTLVLLVRHGQTATTGVVLPGRRPGLHLSDVGLRQAEAVGQRIGALSRVAAIYTSPLERARETAVPIARVRRLTPQVERGLLEIDIGAWAGLRISRARRRKEWAMIQHHPSGFRFPGGESFTEMQARMTTTLEDLVGRHPGQAVVAVSHADPIKATVAHALGVPLDLFQRIAIGTGSVTAIGYRPEAVMLLTLNSIDGDLTWLQAR